MKSIEPWREDIEKAKQGNRDAMYSLYKHYSAAMLNTAYRILNHQEDAEDAVQESFVKAFSRLQQFAYQSTFGAWLKRIVVNQSINELKKRKSLMFQHEEFQEDVISEFELEEDHTDQLDMLYKALHELPDGYRTVISLYMLEGYDHKEIADILNIGVSTSISQLSRAKNKLKQQLVKGKVHG